MPCVVSKEGCPDLWGAQTLKCGAKLSVSQLSMETEKSAKYPPHQPPTNIMFLSLFQAKSTVQRVWLPLPVIPALGWITSLRPYLDYTEDGRKSQ